MSADLIPMKQDLDSLWAAYVLLTEQALADPKLMVDVNHSIARVRAHRRWAEVFNAQDECA